MRRLRNAKIVATLGPATCNEGVIKTLLEKGADVFRLNFSHGTHEDHQKNFEILRKLEQDFNRPITILMDLQGPKLRVGAFAEDKVLLKTGQVFTFDLNPEPGNYDRVCLPHLEIFKAIQTGTDLLLDDGKLRLKVIRHSANSIETTVTIGGELSNRKGVNVPAVMLPLSALTDKDRRDLDFGLALGVDWIALSFVQKPEDILEAQQLIQGRAKIIAKLEKPTAIQYLDEIVRLADGVMVARGDLGVEILPEEVPSIQKRIIHSCRQAGKPVVVATQMLDSMVHSPSPTRAEASDVASAIYDGVDAVMLSAETASGEYPLEAVAMMDRIISQTERDPVYRQMVDYSRPQPQSTVADSITASARQIAHIISIPVIVTFSETGSTTLKAARERPESPILALAANLQTARFLGLVWGVHAVLTPSINSFSEMVETACHIACNQDFAKSGEHILITAGVPFGTAGGTNILRIAKID
mgnify:CR=1 FL=1